MSERGDNVLGHLRTLAAEATDEQLAMLVQYSEADVQVRLLAHRRELLEAKLRERSAQRTADGRVPLGLQEELSRLGTELATTTEQAVDASSARATVEAILREQLPGFDAARQAR